MGARRADSALFCAVLLSLWASVHGLLSPTGVNNEVLALMDIKNSLDPQNVLKNWDENAVDPCSWIMISCEAGFVTVLESPSQNLSGKLSPSIGNLPNLRSLLLQNNDISGHIPFELGRLPRLENLDLSNNSFSGEIPRELSHLKNLQYLRLNHNNLSGAIPASFTDLTRLALLDLSYNNLSGPVPRLPARTFNIVGNPLKCGGEGEIKCFVTTPAPVSLIVNSSQNSQPSGKPKSHKIALAFGSALSCSSLLIFGFGFFFWFKRRRSRQIFFDVNEQQHEEINLGNLKKFHLRELADATDNFSSKNLIGKGGSGNVYKGCLRDGTVVAIKRLKTVDDVGEEIQFQTELKIISLAVHRNLLRLHGFCMTAKERLLVYPFMSNGSVAFRLKAKPTLDWSTRKRIALGAARGLSYLHEHCDPKIIHRDVKAANILLDDYYEAVIGDFGLAKLLDHQDSHVTTAVRGTAGHIAPEYLLSGQSSEKTDVFGFGILLLELITGLKVLEFGKAINQRGTMLDWVRNADEHVQHFCELGIVMVKKIHEENKIEMLLDKELKDNYDRIELEEMVQVTLLCTQNLPTNRPKMSEVVRMLEGDGLVEKWEVPQRAESTRCRAVNQFSSSERYSDLTNDSCLLIQSMELSGPR